METVQCSKAKLSKLLDWSSSRYNDYTKPQAIEIIINLVSKGEDCSREFVAGCFSAGAHGYGSKAAFRNSKLTGGNYTLNIKNGTAQLINNNTNEVLILEKPAAVSLRPKNQKRIFYNGNKSIHNDPVKIGEYDVIWESPRKNGVFHIKYQDEIYFLRKYNCTVLKTKINQKEQIMAKIIVYAKGENRGSIILNATTSGKHIAVVSSTSREFKTIKAAEKFMATYGYEKVESTRVRSPNFQFGSDGTSFPKSWSKEKIDEWYATNKPEITRKEQIMAREDKDVTQLVAEAVKNGTYSNKAFEELLRTRTSQPVQGETPSPERRDINSKENNMSELHPDYAQTRGIITDAFMSDMSGENEGQARNPKEEAFWNTVHQRKVIADALAAGKLSCLPGDDGYADTRPAVNLVNGTFYHGANLLFLKEHQKENGFPSAEYVTIGQIERARLERAEKGENAADLIIRKGQKGVSIYISEKNEETGDWENKSFRLFNVAQIVKPAVMKEWAEQQRQEKLQEKMEYMQTQYGTGYKLPEPKQKEPGPEIVCSSTEPEKYLGQYLAAVSMGGKFKASKEQAAEFAQKLETSLFERMENGHTNPFKLEKISIEAGRHCKDVIREVRMEARKAEQSQQQEQTQTRGLSM